MTNPELAAWNALRQVTGPRTATEHAHLVVTALRATGWLKDSCDCEPLPKPGTVDWDSAIKRVGENGWPA